MNRDFNIIANGTDLGIFTAASEAEAKRAYIREAGYKSLEDMAERLCRTEQGIWDELIAKEVVIYAYAFDQNGDIVATSEDADGARAVLRLYRKLTDGYRQRTGFIHDLEEVDETTDETIDIYVGCTELRGNFDIWTHEGGQYRTGVNLKPSQHCAAWQRERRRLGLVAA